jgi:hypothetical protein
MGTNWVQVSTVFPTSTTLGADSGTVANGNLNLTNGTIGLTGGVPTATTIDMALVATATIGGVGYEGIIAFANNSGGNPIATPPGVPAVLTGWGNLNENLVLSPIPEPSTLALAGLGGLTLLLFRRRQS